MKRSSLFFVIFAFIFSINSFAQNNPQRSPLNPTVWGVVYDVPATKDIKVKTDVPYLKDAKGTLAIDIYAPANMKAVEKLPAVIFLNAIGDRPDDKIKNWEIYKSFPRLVAAHGMIGISMEADETRIQESLRSLFSFLEKEGANQGIDATRLGVYAASANVYQSAIYLMSDTASKGIKAAVLYYGGAPEGALRRDLPVLFVIAEGDMARLGTSMTALWQRVTESRAPWTMVYGSRMPHAFDAFADNDESRRLIRQTIDFWKTYLEPVPQPGWKPSEARAIVAALYGGDANKAADLLSKYVAENPTDAQGYISYGRMLQQLQRYDEAIAAFEKAKTITPVDPFAHAGIGLIRFAQKRYEEAAANFSKAIDGGFHAPMVYGQLGYSQLVLNRNEEAVKTYEKAFELGIPPGANSRGLAYYNMACAYARLKQTDKAFEMLNKAVDEGFVDRQTYETDTDFVTLRTDPRFQQLLKRMPPAGAATQTNNSTPKKQFVIVLRLNPKYQDEKNWTEADNQAVGRHFAKLQQLQKDGKLTFAGRTLNKESMGVVILEVETEAEARAVMDADDAVKAGIMSAEVLPFQTALIKGN